MTGFMLAPKGKKCPFTGFQEDCRDLVTSGKCQDTWQHIQGLNPLTGATMNQWGCAYHFTWLFAAAAAAEAHHSRADTLTLRNMIFDRDVRDRELAKDKDLRTIEDQTCKSP